jgi:hypothetical protein
MIRKLGLIWLALFTVFISGCSTTTIEPAKRFGGVRLEALGKAYVVLLPDADRNIALGIQKALAQHGVKATVGPMNEKPKDADFYVNYVDHWRWDLAMYLYSLSIDFIDNSSGETIGTGTFGPVKFHTFPDPKKKAVEVVDNIYNAK